MDKQKNTMNPALEAGLKGAALGLLIGIAFVAGLLADDFLDGQNTTADFDILRETDNLLDQHYLRALPSDEDLVYGAAEGYVRALEDPYTYFVEPQTAEVNQGDLAGRFGGIGAQIQLNDTGEFVILRVYNENPAAEAGLQADDIIVAVDGEPTTPGTMDMDGLISTIRGEVGTTVTITVRRGNEELTFDVTRAEVLIPSVFWEMTDNDTIGYIQVTRFTDRAPEEVGQGIDELREAGAEALILDLRNNGGGLVDSAVDILDEFIDGGVVLTEREQNGREEIIRVSRGGKALDIPLAVLVNGGSASASEIVAGALQDLDRATLIGQQTFGKGSVQLIFELSDGSSLYVTNSEWFTPAGNPIDQVGLTPDIVIEPVEGQDAELEEAIRTLALATVEQ